MLFIQTTQKSMRNAIRGNFLKWRNGKIPYVLSNDYSEESRTLIARVFEEFHNKTCVRFVPKRWFHFNYLHLTPGVGCASLVGRVGGQQAVTLGEGCLTLGIIEHELLHSIGFWHEQSRADRDDFVRINWDNVEKGMEGNFVKFSWNDIQSLGVEYDYASVMHYGTHAFAKGFGATLSAVKDVPQGVKIGQRIAMSEKDIKKINNLYDCNKDVRNDNIISALLRLIIDIKNML
ncbi:unnamed protein product [Medioppia subpectinata]|uniref:Metalloendopeptidase n=1 Tax=Medioppia subpectinata TaxID=1979941 RepID=A0A7R9QB87_9ACAR|nr:unnamed protein product [Medioppia subpectinata]CAG2117157.1 unnamed protein product [Medioppia subpectinata]